MPPGLSIETPYVISGLPGGFVNAGNNSTTFYDATLLILPTNGNTYGLPAQGSAQTPGAGLFYQQLGGGNLQIWTTDLTTPVGNPPSYQGTLLLGGSITSTVITGLLGSGSGSVISASITYNSGTVWDAAEGLPTGSSSVTPVSGELSWSLETVSPTFSVTSGVLAPFQAQATGQLATNGAGAGTGGGNANHRFARFARVLAVAKATESPRRNGWPRGCCRSCVKGLKRPGCRGKPHTLAACGRLRLPTSEKCPAHELSGHAMAVASCAMRVPLSARCSALAPHCSLWLGRRGEKPLAQFG